MLRNTPGLKHCLIVLATAKPVCFEPYEHDSRHGNFLPESYKAIRGLGWRRRLVKVHTQGRRAVPANERGRWMELDSCMGSDALLMNIFCHPGVSRGGGVPGVLGAEPGMSPCFGYKARVPLANGRFDRTEILRIGSVTVRLA
jgi:hypothetical protein